MRPGACNEDVPITLGSNIASLMTQRQLAKTSESLSQTYERLSSGMRINRACDDAAGLAIASSLNADRRILSQGIRNLNDGLSVLSIADNATTALTDIVIRIRELATQAANGTFSATQRSALDTEAQALAEEYFRVSRSTEFNGRALFDGSLSELRLQGGYGLDGGVAASLGGVMGSGGFGAGCSYQTESYYSVCTTLSDLNGDGVLDLVTSGLTDTLDGYVTIRFGMGDGSFGSASSYLMESSRANCVVLDDLNGDGILDLVSAGVSDANDGYATIRLGVGDGTFGVSRSYETESKESRAITLGDLNGDGILDLVTAGEADSNDGYTTIRLGMGDGTFGVACSYLTESTMSRAVALGDLNKDGILDLVTAGATDSSDGYATIRLGVGDGSFASAHSYQTESGYSVGVALGDLNNDGNLDLVSAGKSDGNDGYATIRLGVGDGSFGSACSYQTESFISLSTVLGDLNSDGILDLITAGISDENDGYTTIRLGQGDGSFASPLSYSTESYRSDFVTLGDLNNDGVLDLVTAGRTDGNDGYATVRLGSTRSGVAPLLPFSIRTQADAKWAMSLMDQKLTHLAAQRSTIGSFQSRVGIAVSALQSTVENYVAAESRIRNADMADESASLVRQRILQQAAAAILAHANQQPGLVLSLLGG